MNSVPELWFLRAIMFLVLVIGGIISYYAMRSWKHTRTQPMFFLGVGFALVSTAAAAAGVIFEVITSEDYLTSWIASAAIMLAGFFLILYSLLISSAEKPAEEK